jgi:hypothetical protein
MRIMCSIRPEIVVTKCEHPFRCKRTHISCFSRLDCSNIMNRNTNKMCYKEN